MYHTIKSLQPSVRPLKQSETVAGSVPQTGTVNRGVELLTEICLGMLIHTSRGERKSNFID